MLAKQISDDFVAAFKAKETFKKDVLNMMKSAIKYVELEKGELSDEDVIDILSKEVKKRKDSISQYEEAGRPELAENEQAELDIISVYLPEQMSEEEIAAIVSETISELGITGKEQTGQLMGALMPKVKGKADGGLVKKVVDSQLA